MEQLSSDGVLLVQRDDVVLRFPTATGDDLRPLLMQADPRWRIMNVLGSFGVSILSISATNLQLVFHSFINCTLLCF